MPEFNIYESLLHPGSMTVIHNVRLVDAQPDGAGFTTFTIEHQEKQHVLAGGTWSEEWSKRDIGKIGRVWPDSFKWDETRPHPSVIFSAYYDQSLRRVPELDSSSTRQYDDQGRRACVIGWACDMRPAGFRAPIGIIPGEDGIVIDDETIPVVVRVPPEFVQECRQVGRTPLDVLTGFIGDLAGINNYCNRPRADGYGSNGSDERMYAENWLDRAYGMYRVDVLKMEQADQEREEREHATSDLESMMFDYLDKSGSIGEFLDAVQGVVDAKSDPSTTADPDASSANPFASYDGSDDAAFKARLLSLIDLALAANDTEEYRLITADDKETLDRAITATVALPKPMQSLSTLMLHLPGKLQQKLARWVQSVEATALPKPA